MGRPCKLVHFPNPRLVAFRSTTLLTRIRTVFDYPLHVLFSLPFSTLNHLPLNRPSFPRSILSLLPNNFLCPCPPFSSSESILSLLSKMPESKEYDYSSVEGEEEEAFLGDDGYERGGRRSSSKKSSRLSWLLHAAVSVTSLLVGGVIGYSLRRDSTSKGLAFADTSPLRLCKKPPLNSSCVCKLIIQTTESILSRTRSDSTGHCLNGAHTAALPLPRWTKLGVDSPKLAAVCWSK